MVLSELINLLVGVKVIVTADNIGSSQCVDPIQLANRVLGGPRFTGDAKDIFNQAGTTYTQIANTADNQPQAWDIVVWGANAYHGASGHVALATGQNTDSTKFEVLSQNDPFGSDCEIKSYDYTDILGWLRPNVLPETPTAPLQPEFTDQTKLLASLLNSPDYPVSEDLEIQQLRGKLGDLGRDEKQITALNLQVENDGVRIADLEKQLQNAQQSPNLPPNPSPTPPTPPSTPLPDFLVWLKKLLGR